MEGVHLDSPGPPSAVQDSEVTDQHQAAFLEFDEDHDEKFSKPEVAELLLCMDKAQQCKTRSCRHGTVVCEAHCGSSHGSVHDIRSVVLVLASYIKHI